MRALNSRDATLCRRQNSKSKSAAYRFNEGTILIQLTPTKLRDWLQCRAMYKLKHIDRVGYGDGASPALAFGRSLHSALEAIHKPGNEMSVLPPLDQLLNRYWDTGAFADKQESRDYFTRGCTALGRYMEEVGRSESRENRQVMGTEMYLSHVVRVSDELRIRFSCKTDKIEICGESLLEITDYKTNNSGRVPTLESLVGDLPMFITYLLVRICYKDFTRVRLTYLNVITLTRVSVEYTNEQIATNKQALIACCRAFAGDAFTPRSCEACAWCSVQEFCPLNKQEVELDVL